MKYELYLTEADARHYAEEYAAEVNGFVTDRITSVDDRTHFDYKDRDVQAFAGECPAYEVIGAAGEIGYFGWAE